MPAIESVKEVFEVAQNGSQHKKMLFKALDILREKYEHGDFTVDFIHYMKYCMIVFKKEPAVERLVDFVAEYATRRSDKRDKHNSSLSDGSDEESEDSNTTIFLSNLLEFLLEAQNASDKAVRYRSCQLISKIFEKLDEEATISEEIADKMMTCMLERLCDKIPIIRCQAVSAMSRLQDPLDPECPVVAAFVYLMTSDATADVRKTVLLNVVITKVTLAHIIERTRDVKDSVRKLAYFVLGEKVSIRALTIAQRVQLLQDGLKDRVLSVRKMCETCLVRSWLKSCEDKVVDFLALLDVQNSLETVEIVLRTLLKGVEGDDVLMHVTALKESIEPGYTGHTIPFDKLTCERLLYWHYLVEHCSKSENKAQHIMDILLPEISLYSEYIQKYIDDNFTSSIKEDAFDQAFILEQLLKIAGFMDFSDEVGRKNLSKLIHELMINPEVPVDLTSILHERYMSIEPDCDVQISQVAEMIADIREPIMVEETPLVKETNRAREVKIASLKVKLNELRDHLESFVNAQNYEKAAEVKNEITQFEEEKMNIEKEDNTTVNSNYTRVEKNDPVTLVKCLSIAAELLQGITKSGLNPTLVTLVETLILPGVQNEDPLVRNAAVRCIGLCSLLSRDFARRHMVLLLQIVLLDVEQVQITSLKAILDLLQTFGLEAFKVTPAEQAIVEAEESLLDDMEDIHEHSMSSEQQHKTTNEDNNVEERVMEEAQKSVSGVFSVLLKLLDRENCDIRNIAAEGLAKLLLSGRIHSPKLLSRLLLLWYNPTTAEDNHLRHSIGVFLPAFAFECRANQELVEEAFLPTLRTLFSAPISSPLARVDVFNVAELLVQLTIDQPPKPDAATTQENHNTITAGSLHCSLASKLANEVLSDMDAPGVRVLCRTLCQLTLNTADKSNLKDLLVLCYSMLKKTDDNICKKYLNKFHQTLISLTTEDTTISTENEANSDKMTETVDNETSIATTTTTTTLSES